MCFTYWFIHVAYSLRLPLENYSGFWFLVPQCAVSNVHVSTAFTNCIHTFNCETAARMRHRTERKTFLSRLTRNWRAVCKIQIKIFGRCFEPSSIGDWLQNHLQNAPEWQQMRFDMPSWQGMFVQIVTRWLWPQFIVQCTLYTYFFLEIWNEKCTNYEAVWRIEMRRLNFLMLTWRPFDIRVLWQFGQLTSKKKKDEKCKKLYYSPVVNIAIKFMVHLKRSGTRKPGLTRKIPQNRMQTTIFSQWIHKARDLSRVCHTLTPDTISSHHFIRSNVTQNANKKQKLCENIWNESHHLYVHNVQLYIPTVSFVTIKRSISFSFKLEFLEFMNSNLWIMNYVWKLWFECV